MKLMSYLEKHYEELLKDDKFCSNVWVLNLIPLLDMFVFMTTPSSF